MELLRAITFSILTRAAIQSVVTSSVTVSEGEVLQKYKDDNIYAKFDYTFLDPATITDTSFNVCTNDELKKYYDENKIKFKQEEAVKPI